MPIQYSLLIILEKGNSIMKVLLINLLIFGFSQGLAHSADEADTPVEFRNYRKHNIQVDMKVYYADTENPAREQARFEEQTLVLDAHPNPNSPTDYNMTTVLLPHRKISMFKFIIKNHRQLEDSSDQLTPIGDEVTVIPQSPYVGITLRIEDDSTTAVPRTLTSNMIQSATAESPAL